MTGGWWGSKIRRFVRYFIGRVSTAERKALAGWLSAAQLDLFDSMHRADQRHGLDVVAALKLSGHDKPELLLAGLLHDCGKGRRLRVWHRICWSLAERYGSRVQRTAMLVPGFRSAFATIEAHAERSAELALAAGVGPLTADLIRNQAEPTDEVLGRALLLADQAN
jgi:hypothetical protein